MCIWCVCVCVCVCVCACDVSVCVSRHETNTNLNVVIGSTVLATGPMALHARTSVNVISG